MKSILREPLLHFVVLGILLFVVDGLLRERGDSSDVGEIVVTQGRVENLAALFAKTRQRPPSAEELRGLVDDYVLEEALYREGVALGVDRGDTVIRRRVRQKMEFVVDDIVELREPRESELEAWLTNNAASYARPGRLSFRQVFLSPERRGEAIQDDAERLLAQLRSNEYPSLDPRELGDRSLLKYAHNDTTVDLIAAGFGREFAERVADLPVGRWSGPVGSAFGLHLVLVDTHSRGRNPSLDEVRDEVVRDWRYAQRELASRQFYDDLLGRYRIRIDWPAAPADSEEAVAGDRAR